MSETMKMILLGSLALAIGALLSNEVNKITNKKLLEQFRETLRAELERFKNEIK